MTTMMANIAAQTPQNRDLRRRRRRVAGDWARPAGSRPVRVANYRERGAAGVSGAPHPLGDRVSADPVPDRLSTPQLIAAGLLSATVVAALIGVAHWRAGQPEPAPAPPSMVAPQPDAGIAGNAQ